MHPSAADRTESGDEPDTPPAPPAAAEAQLTDELFPLVYQELRQLADRHLAHEPAEQRLQPTALVHETYLRLAGRGAVAWQNRAHFFGAAARAIRRILIDRARARGRDKRGAGVVPVPLVEAEHLGVDGPSLDVLALDEALQRLAQLDPPRAQLVELRFFGGLTGEEAARVLGVSPATAARDWQFARIWLRRELTRENGP